MRRRKLKPRAVYQPQNWQEFIGHAHVVSLLRTAQAAAQKRNETLRPILLFGPSGCGKTSLARLIAGKNRYYELSGASLEAISLVSSLMNVRRSGYVLIDEIHALSKKCQEVLYPVLDDNVVMWAGTSSAVALTLIGTTTEIGKLSIPLRGRFSLTAFISDYSKSDIAQIVDRAAKPLGLTVSDGGAAAVAKWSRGIPRLAIRILERVRDIASAVSEITVQTAVTDLGFDESGLLSEERAYLQVLAMLGGRSGLANIAAALQASSSSVKSLEVYLLHQRFIQLMPSGRVLSTIGLDYLNDLEDSQT